MTMLQQQQQQQDQSQTSGGGDNTTQDPNSEISMKMFAMQVNPDGSMAVKQIPTSPGKTGGNRRGKGRGRKNRVRIKQNSQGNADQTPVVCCLDPSQQPTNGQQQDPTQQQQPQDPSQQQAPPDYQALLDQLNSQSPDYTQNPPPGFDPNGNFFG